MAASGGVGVGWAGLEKRRKSFLVFWGRFQYNGVVEIGVYW